MGADLVSTPQSRGKGAVSTRHATHPMRRPPDTPPTRHAAPLDTVGVSLLITHHVSVHTVQAPTPHQEVGTTKWGFSCFGRTPADS